MQNIFEAIFLIIAGLGMCGVSMPDWLRIIGGICGVVAGVMLVV